VCYVLWEPRLEFLLPPDGDKLTNLKVSPSLYDLNGESFSS